MSYLPTTIIRCLLILAIVISAVAAADAEDVAFGYIDKKGTISRIMYYRNGSWEIELLSGLEGFNVHRIIVEKWVDANRGGHEFDCKNKTDEFNRDYICKLPKPLKQISAKELSAYLVTIKPSKSEDFSADIAEILNPDRLTRIIRLYKFQPQGDEGGNNMDLQTYAKLFWNSNDSAFSKWYRIGIPNPVPIRAVHAFEYGGDGSDDCGTGGAGKAIKADIDSAKNHAPGWVATQKSGFVWNRFEEIVNVINHEPVKGRKRFKDIPAQFMPAITKIKARWTESEGVILPKLKMETIHHEKTKTSLRQTFFDKLIIRRAVSSDKNVSLMYFSAIKHFHSPFLPTSDNAAYCDGCRGNVYIFYRGWALLYPDGRIECLSANVDAEGSEDTNVESYTSVSPYALLELDGRRYVIADSSINGWNAGEYRTEIFELADGKFKSRGIYEGSCGGGE